MDSENIERLLVRLVEINETESPAYFRRPLGS